MGRNRFDFQFCRIVIHGAESRSDGRHRTAVPMSKQSKPDLSTPSSTARRDRSSWNTPAATGTGPLAIVASLRGEETLFGPNRVEERPIFRPVALPLAWCRTGPVRYITNATRLHVRKTGHPLSPISGRSERSLRVARSDDDDRQSLVPHSARNRPARVPAPSPRHVELRWCGSSAGRAGSRSLLRGPRTPGREVRTTDRTAPAPP